MHCRIGAGPAGYAFAERAKVLTALKRPEELRLESWDRAVVDRLLSPPHTDVGLCGLERGRRIPGRVFAFVVEALADGVNGKGKSQDRKGGARLETQAPPGLRRYGRKLIAPKDRSIPCVKRVAKRPLQAREVCAVGATARKDRRERLRLEEARKKPARVAERGMRWRMHQQIGLHEVMKGGGTQCSGEGAKVPAQALVHAVEVGARVDGEAV